MTKALSRAQLAGLAEQANSGEGFSVRAFGKDVGTPARDGYVVAVPGRGADFTPAATPEDAASFTTKHRDELEKPNRYFGGFRGDTPPRTAFDVSRLHHSSAMGRFNATVDALRSNQEALGHLDAQGGYSEIANPHYKPSAGHGVRATEDLSAAELHYAVADSLNDTSPRTLEARRLNLAAARGTPMYRGRA